MIEKNQTPNKHIEKPPSDSFIGFKGEVDPETQLLITSIVHDATKGVRMIEASPNFHRFAKDRAISAITSILYQILLDLSVGYFQAEAIRNATTSAELEDGYDRIWKSFNLVWPRDVQDLQAGIESRGHTRRA